MSDMLRSIKIVESWNTGINLLFENAILVPEVDLAFNDWVSQTKANSSWILIGGIVVGFYTRPRTTTDIDVLFSNDESIPKLVSGFKRTRPHGSHGFEHNKTHVEVEVLVPKTINITDELFDQVIARARIHNGVRIPSPSGLVALKIARGDLQDLADIEAIASRHDIDVSEFTLPIEKINYAEKTIGIILQKSPT